MKISELIAELNDILENKGDLKLAKDGHSDGIWYSDNVSTVDVISMKLETRCWAGNLNPDPKPDDIAEDFVVIY